MGMMAVGRAVQAAAAAMTAVAAMPEARVATAMVVSVAVVAITMAAVSVTAVAESVDEDLAAATEVGRREPGMEALSPRCWSWATLCQ